MAEIKKVYRQSMPAMRFIGRRYGEKDKTNNTFSAKWGEWFEKGLFAPLECHTGEPEPFEGANAYYGLSRCPDGGDYDYWIGAFLPAGTPVPDGYGYMDFDPFDIAVCWVYGKEPDIYFHCCLSRLAEEGYTWAPGKDGVKWCFERYVCPRFTEPDGQGNVILDQCFTVDAEK